MQNVALFYIHARGAHQRAIAFWAKVCFLVCSRPCSSVHNSWCDKFRHVSSMKLSLVRPVIAMHTLPWTKTEEFPQEIWNSVVHPISEGLSMLNFGLLVYASLTNTSTRS